MPIADACGFMGGGGGGMLGMVAHAEKATPIIMMQTDEKFRIKLFIALALRST
jgi:hypothetical protein